jgi:hypothetical protein
MKRMTADEFRAYRAAHEERIQPLRALAARIKAELEPNRREKPA